MKTLWRSIQSCPLLIVLTISSSRAACTAQAVRSQGLNTTELTALLTRQAQAWEKHDFSIAASDWLPDAELTSPGGRLKASQLPSVIEEYAHHFRDLHVKITHVFISEDGTEAAIEWDWEVTRARDGKHGITHDAILVTFEGKKIKSWREYFDLGRSVDAEP